MNRRSIVPVFLALLMASMLPALSGSAIRVGSADAERIGKRLWQNECGGSVAGLTSWNEGEAFASLGIGHFIWYPKGARGPFVESFPKLARFLRDSGEAVPDWMMGACPWSARAEFVADSGSEKMRSLRALLARTVGQQARFAAMRLESALPEMLGATRPANRERVRRHFERVIAAPGGLYPLVDYVNFKGEGTSPAERYKGEGWGLLQVLESMGDGPSLRAFSDAAIAVLDRRVRNSPEERGEARWLDGWKNRCRSYRD
jgi:hypothetical protein